ncbi:MAG TPA: DUF6496 domain-containing protein [Tepidisphaeraceae bacterium]|jgi:hypothetical protein|nr:DUF6496 domain-containing protein [Tepidisphaeraceae bacterium]
MPEKETLERARKDKREGKAPTTQAGEFIREEMHHIRQGKHGARSSKQAIAIGLSKARRAGVELPPPKQGSAKTKRSAQLAYERGHGRPARSRPSARRSRAILGALKREGRSAASHTALARQAHSAASRRSSTARSAAARKAAATKGAAGRRAAARKAARTRTAA